MKGCSYDNVVAEATFNIMKTEFINQLNFHSFQHLKLELNDYANGYNKHRIHVTLGSYSLVFHEFI
ncbi:IS3 family transposase [Paenibacillus dendritiformis]|uniref:IS3 family transposase n=1 Tax=Paenibacillus TaxID=44249 RepID=UPI003B8A7842